MATATSGAKIESPCTNVCKIDPDTRLCLGCARSIDEISAWSRMTAEARRVIMAELPQRAENLKRQR
ncbi:DUF1289 domain-containing protein [Celeribacter sp.]|uniref:DUF1289 domain-containing protein n=1 Tax=Celeribacter sp. TaxID=1890673 RepID=UPI003A8D640C